MTEAALSRWQPYPAYKPTGVEWLGDIPAHWDAKPLKRVTRFAYGDSLAAENRVEGEVLVYGSNGVVGSHDSANAKAPCIIVGRKGSFGKITFSEQPCFAIDTTFFIDSTQSQHHLRWLLYCLSCLNLDSFSKDSAVPGLAREEAYSRVVPLCSPQEQRAIAAFLDRETTRLDALMAKKQRLIELLQEQRTALISHVVTKGLDPNVALKDSGVEWLGKIPAHWYVMKFSQAAFFQEGPGLRNWQFTDSGVRVICVTNITEFGIDFSRYEKFISHEEYTKTYQHFTVKKGDYLLSSSGNSWGKIAEFESDEPTILNTSTIRLNESHPAILKRRMLKWTLQADNIREQLGQLMTGSCQPNFGPSHFSRTYVPIPPVEEQIVIVDKTKMPERALRQAAQRSKPYYTSKVDKTKMPERALRLQPAPSQTSEPVACG
jgi:type I restriction enzyme, S subunit